MTGLTAEQTTVGVSRQLWLSRQLAALLAERREPGDDPALRVWVAGAHRRLVAHIELWTDQLPESVLLEPYRDPSPDPAHEAMVRSARAAAETAAFTTAVAALLAAIATDLDALVADAGPIGDGALVRAAAIVGRDLQALAEGQPTA